MTWEHFHNIVLNEEDRTQNYNYIKMPILKAMYVFIMYVLDKTL